VSERVTLAGWCDDPPKELGGFDVFVLPSRYEGLPLALMEAMLAGLPIVATSVGDMPDAIVDGEHGLLVKPEDPGALAGALRRVLEDEELGRELGSAAREQALRRFSPATTASQFEKVYMDVTDA
jgi:glycosyltransferase involved in cell wall biosynthesis